MRREYIIIQPGSSLGDLIRRLEEVQAQIPAGSTDEDIRLRGDDIFGRHILVTYAPPREAEEPRRAPCNGNIVAPTERAA